MLGAIVGDRTFAASVAIAVLLAVVLVTLALCSARQPRYCRRTQLCVLPVIGNAVTLDVTVLRTEATTSDTYVRP
jgi:hypothetical protein